MLERAKAIAARALKCENLLLAKTRDQGTEAWDRQPNLTEIYAKAVADPDWFYDYLKMQPGRWLLMPNGQWTRYVAYQAQHRMDPPLPPFRLGSGLSVALERTLRSEELIHVLAQDRDVYAAESPGAGLSAIRNIIEGRYSKDKKIPSEITIESLHQFMTDGWREIVRDALQNIHGLSAFPGVFSDVDHSWAGWVKSELLPKLGAEVGDVTLFTPGSQATNEHLIPFLEVMRSSIEMSARVLPLINPFFYLQRFSQGVFRQSANMAFRSLDSLSRDKVARDLALARLMGIYRFRGYEKLEASDPRRRINIVIAQDDAIVPPSLLLEVVKAARLRGNGRGMDTTTAVIIPGKHEVMEDNPAELYKALGRIARSELKPGTYIFDGAQFHPMDSEEFYDLLSGPLQNEWLKKQKEMLRKSVGSLLFQ